MVVEFSTFPIGAGESLSDVIAGVARIVDGSGMPYQLTSMGTIVEGDWDEVMELVKKCHTALGEKFNRVYTKISIDDRRGAKDRMKGKVESVEKKAGMKFRA